MSSAGSIARTIIVLGGALGALGACAALGKRPPQPTPAREPSVALLHTPIAVRRGEWSGEPECATQLPGQAASFTSLVQALIAGKLRRVNAPDAGDPDALTVTLSGVAKCGNCVPQQAACATQPINFERVRFEVKDRTGELIDAQELELEGHVPSEQADQIATRLLSSARIEAFANEAAARRAQAEAARSAHEASTRSTASEAPSPPQPPERVEADAGAP